MIAAFKASGGAKTFNVFSVRAVNDPNHITRHLLECIYNYLYMTRGPIGGGAGAGAGAGAGTGTGYNPFAAAAVNAAGTAHGDDRSAALGSVDQLVFQIYKDATMNDPENENGLSIQDAMAIGKKQNISAQDIQRLTEKLMMDGMIYSTIDDSHFRST